MQCRAAILHEHRSALAVETVELGPLRSTDVLLRVSASGICGSDLHLVGGRLAVPTTKGPARLPLPIVPGHEAAGVVEAVGDEVRGLAAGDHVIVNVYPGCGRCAACMSGTRASCANPEPGLLPDGRSRIRLAGRAVHHMANCSSFAEFAIVPEAGCVRIRSDMPLDRACLIGCAVATGYGAVFKVAHVAPGTCALVVGAGGVGLNVIQCCRLAAATTIIAVDVSAAALERATAFGATHVFDGRDPDWVAAVRALTGGGVDYAFEAVSSAATARAAFDATRERGLLAIVGLAEPGSETSYPTTITKTVTRAGLAWCDPHVDYPRLVELYLAGRLDLDGLIDRRWALDEVNDALAAVAAGGRGRAVLSL